MHWIEVLIAPVEVLNEARKTLTSAVVCPLRQGFVLIPFTADVEGQLRELARSDELAVLPQSGRIVPGTAELAAKLSNSDTVVYAATFIHGGTGGQDAIVWRNGEVVVNLGDDEDNMSRWPNSPISLALRQIGVTTEEGEDEFDALGLGRHRSNESWANAYRSTSAAS